MMMTTMPIGDASEIKNWLQKINSPYSSTRETMEWLVEKLLMKYRNIHPRTKYPYSVYKIAKELCKIEVIEDQRLSEKLMSPEQSGSLRVKKDGFVVFLPPFHPKVRKNFSLAHEIGHTCFYDKHSSPPSPLIPSSFSNKMDVAKEIERLCDIFATNLLLPKNEVLKFAGEINNGRCDILTIEKLAKHFGVSIKTFVIRIKELKLIDNTRFFIILIEQKKGKDIHGEIIKNPGLPIKLNLSDKYLSISNLSPHKIDNLIIRGELENKKIALTVPTKIYKGGTKKKYGVGVYYIEKGLLPTSQFARYG